LHGMGFAPGVWFLLEEAWEKRTEGLRRALAGRVRGMGYPLLDVDRRGEKGFRRIAPGFSTRPDSRAMRAFFEARGEPETGALFRPSSMELVRSLGGDPLTVVSELPLFLLAPQAEGGPPFRPGTAGGQELRRWLDRLVAEVGGDPYRLADRGVKPAPLGDQVRLQLALIGQSLRAVELTG
ncbi:MAG: peptidase M14, partial [Thermoanaerobaculia bacterium]